MKIALVVLLLLASQARANFLPDSLVIENDETKPANITEEQLKEIAARVQTIYAPIVSSFGATLSIQPAWDSKQVNAYASRMGFKKVWKVTVLGGLVRNPALTSDGLTLVICHEMGHHLAGYPYTTRYSPVGRWAANEGQSDYYATQTCAKKVWGNDSVVNASFRTTVAPFAKQKCDQAWVTEQDQNLCYRVAAGSQSISNVLASLQKKPNPDLQTPDPAVVKKTFNAHPDAQCRLDTYFQGSLCRVNFNDSVIPGRKVPGGRFSQNAEQDADRYSCSGKDALGARPSCWFKSVL